MRQQQGRRKRLHRKQRGSALLVTLMVMVGLSLLGLGFVAISETENTISANERNYAQVLAVAESGARLVVESFQSPTWANAKGVLPTNSNTSGIKMTRHLNGPSPYTTASPYIGMYKDTAPLGLLFDKPFKPSPTDRFYGDENHPDVLINNTNSSAFLKTFNNAISSEQDTWPNGQVTEIRLFAPPVMSGNLNTYGFYEGGTRYGLCTIRVTAQKFVGSQSVATRVVKLVISEWPFPGPQGPVQSNANISTGGNFGVHWGRMTSDKQMDVKLPLVGLPWFDAWERIHFEWGYYADGQDSNGNSFSGTPSFCDGYNWLYKLSEVSFEDPWYEARAKTDITNTLNPGSVVIASQPDQPFKFSDPAQDITLDNAPPYTGYSNWFQRQSNNDAQVTCGQTQKKLVIFPKIDYDFWKNLSQSASSTISGVHYLQWTPDAGNSLCQTGDCYTDGITKQSFAKWVNTARAKDPAKSGFYFFDTQNGLNPQAGGPGVLAPAVYVNSADDGATFKMQGFMYLNGVTFGTKGIGGPDGYYNFPGEPFRDIGYQQVCDSAGNPVPIGGAGAPTPWNYCSPTVIVGANTGDFSFQDLNGNGVADIFLAQRTVTPPGGGAPITEWYPVKWFSGCTPGFNGVAGANCSEPHEPFLNLVYPDGGTSGTHSAAISQAAGGGGSPIPVVAKWEDPVTANAVTRLSKTKDPNLASGDPLACSATALIAPTDLQGNPLSGPNVPDRNCTSNGYDKDGPLTFNLDKAAIMDGVLYNEGDYDTEGNATYFGSILINGNIGGTGTPSVWFDEFLIKGGWQDKFKDLPRVFITSNETDQ